MSYEFKRDEYVMNTLIASVVETLESAYKIKDIGDDNYRIIAECMFDVTKDLEKQAKAKKETKRKGE